MIISLDLDSLRKYHRKQRFSLIEIKILWKGVEVKYFKRNDSNRLILQRRKTMKLIPMIDPITRSPSDKFFQRFFNWEEISPRDLLVEIHRWWISFNFFRWFSYWRIEQQTNVDETNFNSFVELIEQKRWREKDRSTYSQSK